MALRTFVEKIFNASHGSIVFAKPDIILSHDNTSSIEKTFRKMGGKNILNPENLMVVLDHNAPPTNANLANSYEQIRRFVGSQKVERFHDCGEGICHQLMTLHAKPGMIIVGSDSHTCTAGAFNAFAAGIDRTETAGLWMQGETWFMVPGSVKITLHGKLNEHVYAKDLALYIMGRIGSSGADYMSIEYHGDGVEGLTIADRMTIANLASEMGAKNAVFPPDIVLQQYYNQDIQGVWADPGASYAFEMEIDLDGLVPAIACPHRVDNIKYVDEVKDIPIGQALIGTCTNGRIEDLRVAASILKDKHIPAGFQLLVAPASREIYLMAMREGLLEIFLNAGANILSPSCGPCLGTGQGIPADGVNVISTANRNFPGRMGNSKSSVYLASPATVAISALNGKITSPSSGTTGKPFYSEIKKENTTVLIPDGDNRYYNGIWAYNDIDDLNTDQMFAGSLTYEINSSEPEKIVPHLFQGFDPSFAGRVRKNDILICGSNFGCGSSREHPVVGLVHAGVKLVIARSVARIFYRSAINQGLPVIVLPKAVEAYQKGDPVTVDLELGKIGIAGNTFGFEPLPEKLLAVLKAGGLAPWILKHQRGSSGQP
jgi:3-isopropylmalate/(R)-2-methylmalate dehydratase large subunit